MHTKFPRLVALFLVLALRSAFAHGGRSQLTAADARACGQAFRDTMVAAYGRIDDPDWNRFIGLVVERLRRATAFPGLEIDATIIDDTTVNASSLPGGFVLVNVGLLRYAADLAKVDAPNDSAVQSRRTGAYVAAVLGHELAHVTLGHVIEGMGRDCQPMSRSPRSAAARDTGAAPRPGFDRELRISRSVIEEARYSFFFSSRRRHTRFDCDWSSDVCSSDLRPPWPTSPSTRSGSSPAPPAPSSSQGSAPVWRRQDRGCWRWPGTYRRRDG